MIPEKGSVVVTKIHCFCGYVFEYVLLCGDIGSFGTIQQIRMFFINELCWSCGGGTINGYSSDKLLTILVALLAQGIGFKNIVFSGGLTTAIINESLYSVNGYLNCFNTERESGIVFDTNIPLETSNNIVLKFFEKQKDDLNVMQRCDDISMNTNTKQNIVIKVYLTIF